MEAHSTWNPLQTALRQVAEEIFCCAASRQAELFQGATLNLCCRLGDFLYIRWLAALSPVGDGRQEWTVGFKHEPVQRCLGEGIPDVLAVLEGQDAGKTHQGAQ